MIILKSGEKITTLNKIEDKLLCKFMNFQGFKIPYQGREIKHTDIDFIKEYKVSEMLEETKHYERKMEKISGITDLRKSLSKQGIIKTNEQTNFH